MAGYLDAYGEAGAADARRAALIKRIVLWGFVVIIAASAVYFTFRTWPQEQIMKQFLALLRAKDFQRAYTLWGCTPENPCKYYPPEKFLEDFGPTGVSANIVTDKLEHVDYCDSVVVFSFAAPNGDPFGITVDRSTGAMGFAPWPRCPGRHLQLGGLFRSK